MTVTPSVLRIGLNKLVAYQGDSSDPSLFATDPNVTPPNPALKNFFVATLIGDITSVNGDLAKGTYFGRTRVVNSMPPPPNPPIPGVAIADVMRIAMREHFFEIINEHGIAIGTIMSSGFAGGVAPPGWPAAVAGNWAITGGTGAYVGARGQVGGSASPRGASMLEDPSRRRIHPFDDPDHNGTGTFRLHVIPADPPQVMTAAFGPHVVHMNSGDPVTTGSPAAPGESLLLFASGLGPTIPDVDLSSPFPAAPSNVGSPSPLTVFVHGIPANVVQAFGVPHKVNEYNVLFEMPTTATPPTVSLHLRAAWISGPAVRIPVA